VVSAPTRPRRVAPRWAETPAPMACSKAPSALAGPSTRGPATQPSRMRSPTRQHHQPRLVPLASPRNPAGATPPAHWSTLRQASRAERTALRSALCRRGPAGALFGVDAPQPWAPADHPPRSPSEAPRPVPGPRPRHLSGSGRRLDQRALGRAQPDRRRYPEQVRSLVPELRPVCRTPGVARSPRAALAAPDTADRGRRMNREHRPASREYPPAGGRSRLDSPRQLHQPRRRPNREVPWSPFLWSASPPRS
jgi:hypothetical protein